MQELGEWEFRGCRQDLSPIASSPANLTSLGEEGTISLWRNFLWETLENAMGGDGSSVPCEHLLGQGTLSLAGCETGGWSTPVLGSTTPGSGGTIATQ